MARLYHARVVESRVGEAKGVNHDSLDDERLIPTLAIVPNKVALQLYDPEESR
jgi:hypothetical protein